MSIIRPTRRDVIRSLVAAGAGASALSLAHQHPALAGVAPRSSGLTSRFQETVELTWAINALSGTEIEMVQAVADQFVALNPNYEVTVLNYDPETYDQKLLTDISAGTLPDLFVSADIFTKPFFDANLTADLRPLAESTGFDLSLFDDNRVSHSSVLQSGLFQNTVQSAFRHVNAGMSGNRHKARFGCVFVMTVTAARPHMKPTIVFDHSDDISDFHREFSTVAIR